MNEHIVNLKQMHNNAKVQIPNEIFLKLSNNISLNGKSSIKQISFAYTYIVLATFLYKYAYYIDIENKNYIQNKDMKKLLGYSETTKSVDYIIKKDGLLDTLGITSTTRDFIVAKEDKKEKINNIGIVEYLSVNDLSDDSGVKSIIKGFVKNKNYEIKEPMFLLNPFEEREFGTLYDYSNTHTITIDEMLYFINSSEMDNIDFLVYSFIKSKCKGFKGNSRNISLSTIVRTLKIDHTTFYKRMPLIKKSGLIRVNHKGWQRNLNFESNTYMWVGL